MDAKELAKATEKYMTEPVDVDELDGPYAVKGMFMDEDNGPERVEVGTAGADGYRPLFKLVMGPEPEPDGKPGSYLDADDFSGTAYNLTDSEYTCLKDLAEVA